MTANELRIGNLVNAVLTNETYTIDIWALRTIEDGNYQNSYHTETKVFEPIPLTEEWLLKFGFEHSHRLGSRNFYFIGNLFIEIGVNECSIYYTNRGALICFINYVHQLQNIYFSLTGEELTFKSE